MFTQNMIIKKHL